MTLLKSELLSYSDSGTYTFIDERELRMQKVLEQCHRFASGEVEAYGKVRTLRCESQIEILKEYLEYLLAQNGKYVITSIRSIMYSLFYLGHEFNKPFQEMTKKDLISYFANVKGYRRNQKIKPKQSTIIHKNVYIKQFFKWLYDTYEIAYDKTASQYPEIVDWLSTQRQCTTIEPDKLLTKEDVFNMLRACTKIRDKAIIVSLYEGAFRVGELLSLNIGSLVVDDYGIKAVIQQSKTQKRPIRLIDSTPYIQELLNTHPYHDKIDAPLFINESKGFFGRRLLHQGIYSVVQTAAKRAGIGKRVYPHLLRHSRLDYCARVLNFNERDLRLFAGWAPGSSTPEVYLHYGQEALDNKILAKRGILKGDFEVKQQEEMKKLEPKACVRCGKTHPATAQYCNCGMALDLKAVMEDMQKRETADALMNELFKQEEFQGIVKQFLQKRVSNSPR
ncbi:MAG: tyrosine-type recombinase/integrase [Candidatus Woesearchaeota archaeon]